ncbi:MAG TPA: RnfH family protein [Arenimonas sp.]|uniref:RnfH family protein n=1 Tax=Arenimonas sp. TaxID=1872635 RepID=UPI002D183AA9|nr:RnfH family protein [Arenimonas sp.]HMB58254.1 RnfH family protein [Arenimonas sp.]
MRVDVVYALPERYWSLMLTLPEGAVVADALAMIGKEKEANDWEVDATRLAIFSRPVTAETRLRDGDRLELLRPLLADPKQARRERASGPGKRRF